MQEWTAIRNIAVRDNIALEEQFNNERLSYYVWIREIICKMVQGNDMTLTEFLQYQKLNRYYRAWIALGGRPDEIERFTRFFSLPYFLSLPVWEIATLLHADSITGPTKLQKSDPKDAEFISAVLPIASYILTDRRRANRIRALGLHSRWQAQVFSMEDSKRLISCLESLL